MNQTYYHDLEIDDFRGRGWPHPVHWATKSESVGLQNGGDVGAKDCQITEELSSKLSMLRRMKQCRTKVEGT